MLDSFYHMKLNYFKIIFFLHDNVADFATMQAPL